MRSHLKTIMLLLVSLAMILALAGCTRPVSDIEQDAQPNTSKLGDKAADKSTVQTDTKTQYYFLNGSLLGSYDSNGWHSLCNTDDSAAGAGDASTFYAKDLLNQDSYYVYEKDQQIGVSKQIIWLTEEAFGLGSFESEDAPKNFARYGRLYCHEGESSAVYRIFDLPVKPGPELSNLKIPDYSFHTDFVFGKEWSRNSSCDRLVTNSGANLFPRKLTYDVKPASEAARLLVDLFKTNHMENTNPNFTDCIAGDFDNDGKEERLVFAESPMSELGYPLLCGNGKKDHLGVFNVLFYQDDDGSMQKLYSDLRPYNGEFTADKNNNMELMGPEYCIGIDLFTAADLNSDGVYEIVVNKKEWEGGFYLAYAMDNKGNYEIVMRSNVGM